MIVIQELTYRVGGRLGPALLDNASVQIPFGAKIGLVGRNGAGKSTLLDLIRGTLLPERGDVILPRDHRIGFLAQEAPGGAATPLATVLAADKERAALLRLLDRGAEPLRIAEIEGRLGEIGARSAPARAARILAGLGFDSAMQDAPLDDLSGGWRMRVALAAVLFAEPDLLLLDEPTNHLDLKPRWARTVPQALSPQLILVGHDRQLLNAAPEAITSRSRQMTFYSISTPFSDPARGDRAAGGSRETPGAQRAHMQALSTGFATRVKGAPGAEPDEMLAGASSGDDRDRSGAPRLAATARARATIVS